MNKKLTMSLAIIPAVMISASMNTTWAAEDISFAVKIPGKVITYDKDSIINEINKMRKEAFDNNYFNFKTKFKEYNPIVWNDGLVNVAKVRAAEATVMPSHKKLDGSLSAYGEILAWNKDASYQGALNSWYNEKKKYEAKKDMYDKQSLNGGVLTSDPEVGHYLALVNPGTLSIALAGYVLDPSVSSNNGAVAGAFSSYVTNSSIADVNMEDKTYVVKPNEILKDSSVSINDLNAELPVTMGTEDSVAAKATINIDYDYHGKWSSKLPVVSNKWTSSDTNVIAMGSDGSMKVEKPGKSNISLNLGGNYQTKPQEVTTIKGKASVNDLYPYLVANKNAAIEELNNLQGFGEDTRDKFKEEITNATSAYDIEQIMALATAANKEAEQNIGNLEAKKQQALQDLDKYYGIKGVAMPFDPSIPQEYWTFQGEIYQASSPAEIEKILAEAKAATSPTPAEPPKENTGGETTNTGEDNGSSEDNQDHGNPGAGDSSPAQPGDEGEQPGDTSTNDNPSPGDNNENHTTPGGDETGTVNGGENQKLPTTGEPEQETPGNDTGEENKPAVEPNPNPSEENHPGTPSEEPQGNNQENNGDGGTTGDGSNEGTQEGTNPPGESEGDQTTGGDQGEPSQDPSQNQGHEQENPSGETGEEDHNQQGDDPAAGHETIRPGGEQGETNTPGNGAGEHGTEEQPGSTNEDNNHEATVPGNSENQDNNNSNVNEPEDNQNGGTNGNAGDGSAPKENNGHQENSGDNQSNHESENNSGDDQGNHESQPNNSEDNQGNNGEPEDNRENQPPAGEHEGDQGDENQPPALTPEDVAAIAKAMKQDQALKAADLLSIQDFLMKQKRLQGIVNREDFGLWATVDGNKLSRDGSKVNGTGVTVGYDTKLNHNRLGVVSIYTQGKVGTALLDEKTKAVSVGVYNVYTNKNFFAAVNLDYQGTRLDDLSKINSLNANVQTGLKYKIKEGLSITPQVDYGYAKVNSDDLPNKVYSKYYGAGLQVNYAPSDKLQVNTSLGVHRIILGNTKLYMPKFQNQPGYFVNVNSRKDTAYTMQISVAKEVNSLFSIEGNVGYTKLNNTKLKGFSYGLSANYKF